MKFDQSCETDLLISRWCWWLLLLLRTWSLLRLASCRPTSKTQHLLHSFSGIVLRASEDEALSDTLTPQLVNLDHPAEGDQTHQCVGRQETQRHLLEGESNILNLYLLEGWEFEKKVLFRKTNFDIVKV